MRLQKIGFVTDINNTKGYEAIIGAISTPELLELCTPVVFGKQEVAAQIAKGIQSEYAITFNTVRNASEASDGRTNLVDGFETEADALKAAVQAALNNYIDILVVAPHYEAVQRLNLREFLINTIQADAADVLDWTVSGKTRVTQIGETAEAITTANKALRRDTKELKPRLAIVSNNLELLSNLQALREEGTMAFGITNAANAIEQNSLQPYDAVLFANQDALMKKYIETLDKETIMGYISGLPIVTVYTLEGHTERGNVKEAFFSAIDLLKSRIAYRRATRHPLEKQWIPRGKDDFKLDLTKEEAE